MINKKIRVKLTSYDNIVLDQTIAKIISFMQKNNAKIVGPIPLPTKKEVITILRSPHKHKDSREQFETRLHKRIFDVYSTNIKILNDIFLPAGVDIKVLI